MTSPGALKYSYVLVNILDEYQSVWYVDFREFRNRLATPYPNLRICRDKSQIRGPVATAVASTSGRSDRSASDPEMDTLEVTG